MAAEEIADLIDQLSPDSRRRQELFSPDIQECHRIVFDPESTRLEIEIALSKWLKANQPCLFGRLAANENRISFCILKESDIERGDPYVREMIQRERRIWKADALEGKKHGFIVAIISERVSYSKSDLALQRVAERLCDLYLFDQPQGAKRHDVLRIGTSDQRFFKWFVGVNVFAAQADGHWWSDHRIPGGLAFSMNSVGHMSFARAREKFPTAPDDPVRRHLLAWALPTAMRTIHLASQGPRPGTCLLERTRAMTCAAVPEEIRKELFVDIPEEARSKALRDLAGFSEHVYEGWYDTDESIPRNYFKADGDGPGRLSRLLLYFTYLHSLKDEDYASMGLGEQLFALDADSENPGHGVKDPNE